VSYHWDFSVVWDSFPLLLHGLGVSFMLALAAMAGGSVLGLVLALLRIRRIPILAGIAVGCVELFRNTPIIAQLLWIYYVLPVMTGIRIPVVESAIIAFSLNVGAFMAEIFRAGILSVPRGQREAALAIGLTPFQAFRRVTMPQALQNILPATANVWLSLLKDTSVASVIAIAEIMYEARALAVNTYRPVEVLTVTGGLYFIAVYLQSLAIERFYARSLNRTRRGGAAAR
jgi:His/Glu/Gln/Arg/opine family amino acid ABC transporter permease subunit